MSTLSSLTSLQGKPRGRAMVLDELSRTAEIATTEGILKEMNRRMRREEKPEAFPIEKLAAGRWRGSGTFRLDDFRREYPRIGDVPEVETMGGLLANLLEVVPAVGDSASFRGLKLTAQAADERRVKELLVETKG